MITDLINNVKFIISFVFSGKFIAGAFIAWLITNFLKNREKDREIEEKKKELKEIISSKLKIVIKNIEEKNYMDQVSLDEIKNNAEEDNAQLFEDKIEEIKEDVSIKIGECREDIEEDIDWNI